MTYEDEKIQNGDLVQQNVENTQGYTAIRTRCQQKLVANINLKIEQGQERSKK